MNSRVIVAALAAMASISCNHKELCFDHMEHIQRYDVHVAASWVLAWEYPYEGHTDWQRTWDEEIMGHSYDGLVPPMPKGLRVVSYTDDAPPFIINTATKGGTVGLPPGQQSLLFYNNDTEFITIDNEDSYAHALATTRSRSRLSYTRSDETTLAPPDMLFGCWTDNFRNHATSVPDKIDVEMTPLTFTYIIRYEFSHGINYVALARGALAGMARGVYLHSGINADEPATLLYDCTVETWGAEAVIKSFGLPGFPHEGYSRADINVALNLEVRLYNGKTLTFDVDVSGQLAMQPYGGVIYAGPFEVPDAEGATGGSGFEIGVDDWGEEEDVDIAF